MREQTYRMEGLVKQLLTLSKIEAAPALQLNEKVDVPMMLRVVEHEAQTLSQHKHTFTFDVDNSLNVRGNEEQLRSAISNLVYNAVNHTPAGTHITVRWQHVPSGAEFCVEDNGPGIAAEHIPRLTERFLSRRQGAIAANGRERTRAGHREACLASSRQPFEYR